MEGEPRETELMYEGETRTVTVKTSLSAEWDDRLNDAADGTRHVRSALRAVTTWQITVPQDYDGLVFGVDLANEPENDFDTRDEEDLALHQWSGYIKDWLFFRPDDLTA